MRLIDADALVERIHEICQFDLNKKTAPISWAHAYENFEEDLDTALTVDAIPVEWARKFCEDDISEEQRETIEWMLGIWQNEEKAVKWE